MATFSRTDDLRNAEFRGADLTGARFAACDFVDIVVRGSEIRHVELDSPWLFEGDDLFVRVNGIDVLPLVDAELNGRFPGRAERFATTPDGLRSAWAALDRTWQASVDRVAGMPAGTPDVSVGGEWSFAQTLRHAVLFTDVWLNSAILGKDQPFHPLGLPFTGAERAGMDMSVFTTDEPAYDAVLEAWSGRFAMVHDYLAEVTPDELAALCTNPWAPDNDLTALECVHTILQEGWEHCRYAIRDLDAILVP